MTLLDDEETRGCWPVGTLPGGWLGGFEDVMDRPEDTVVYMPEGLPYCDDDDDE